STPLIWVLFALLGFALLPSKALDYGLWDSTSDEMLEAMGWYNLNLSWSWFLAVLIFPVLSLIFPKESTKRAKIELALIAAIFLFVFISATVAKLA
ncbi:AfuB, partial [Pasteurella multocida subsp. multocida str. Anand1_cattle]